MTSQTHLKFFISQFLLLLLLLSLTSCATIYPPKKHRTTQHTSILWQWPTHGTIVKSYSLNNKGINFSAHTHLVIYAAANGKVVYSGNGLKSYGNLIIIKHEHGYLTAYAYTQNSRVRVGQKVHLGQQIANMGEFNHRILLHFEIRQYGEAVNPLNYLPKNRI